MAEIAMTPMRQNAISILNRIPEERLTVVVQFMLRVDEQARQDDMKARQAAFDRLESMIKPIPDIDEEKELASWREEKFGYAGTD